MHGLYFILALDEHVGHLLLLLLHEAFDAGEGLLDVLLLGKEIMLTPLKAISIVLLGLLQLEAETHYFLFKLLQLTPHLLLDYINKSLLSGSYSSLSLFRQ